jgi:ribosome biogenesis GTPase
MTFEKRLGWNDFLESFFNLQCEEFGAELLAARVTFESRGLYRVSLAHSGRAELWAEVPGKWRDRAQSREDYPAVGDWVSLDPATISGDRALLHALLPRRTRLARRKPGGSYELQIFAAQVDEVLVAASLNHDLSENRIDRALALASEGAMNASIILTKADLLATDALAEKLQKISERFPAHKVLVTSSRNEEGLATLRAHLESGKTYVVLGSSGVGKTSLLNALVGREVLATSEIREEDSKGRHTTTARHLVEIPGGAIFVDTPGIRELQLVGDENALGSNFGDIEALKARCRFSDCRHESESSCAIKEALASGSLSPERWASFRKLQKELAFEARKASPKLMSEERKRWAKVNRQLKEHYKKRG